MCYDRSVPDLLERVVVGPAIPEARGVVIWLHGLGADGHDFEPIVPMLRLPDVRFVFPHAPVRAVTINMGFQMRAWYDILTLEPTDTRESEPDIRASAKQIVALLDHERARGASPERMVLAGFSQGGALALHVGDRYPHPLAGIMALSAYHLVRGTYEAERNEANSTTPMLFCHGRNDPLVPMARGRQAHDDHRHPDRALEWHDYPMQHEVCPPEIQQISTWLAARLPETTPESGVDPD